MQGGWFTGKQTHGFALILISNPALCKALWIEVDHIWAQSQDSVASPPLKEKKNIAESLDCAA